MVNWKRNLAVVWLSQFLSIMGFCFAMPFVPYYMQELGVRNDAKLKLCVALFAAAAPLSLAVCSPIWGAVADRFGRRLMLLRANCGAALLLLAMGSVRSVEMLIFLRLFQGVLTGTFTAAQTLVSVHTPTERNGFALGALSAAVYSGLMAGAFFGGVFAERFGYSMTFRAASLLPLASALLVLVGARENFSRPARTAAQSGWLRRPRLPRIGTAWALLALLAGMAFVRQFDAPMLPLLVQEIHGSLKGAALRTGFLGGLAGLAGLLAGVLLGALADRLPPPRIGQGAALGAGLFMIPQALAQSFPFLFAARFGTVFCAGGLEPVFQVWLAKTTPEHRRGMIFGWAASARALGWVFAPLLSGAVATAFGVRAVYWCSAVLFLMLVPAIVVAARHVAAPAAAPAPDCDDDKH